MIRYDFGEAPETEISEVRKAFDHISALVPVTESVSVTYPVELPKEYDKDGQLIAFVDGQTNPLTRDIAISPMVFDKVEEARMNNAPIARMPMMNKVSSVQFTATHEWGHIVTAVNYNAYVKKLNNHPGLPIMILLSDMSDYGKSDGIEGVAEAFAEWHLSEGKTHNAATQWFARILKWRTSF